MEPCKTICDSLTMVIYPVALPVITVFSLATVLFNSLPVLASKYIPPSFNNMETNVTAFVGDTVVLKCSVSHIGTKSIIWKRSDKPYALTIGDFIFTSDSSYLIKKSKDEETKEEEWNLVIKNVKREHEGRYECQISTKEDLNKTVTLTVLDAPTTSKKPPDDLGTPSTFEPAVEISGEAFVEKGNPIVLRCNATGKTMPPDDVDWFRNGQKITYGGNTKIETYRKSKTKTLYSTLTIMKSKMEDNGYYICRSSDLKIGTQYVNVLNSNSSQSKRELLKNKTDSKAMTEFSSSNPIYKPHVLLHVLTLLVTLSVRNILER